MDEKKLHDHEHEHEHDCDCGCCGGEEEDIVELFDESGKAYKFAHVGGTQFDGKWYVFFLPAEEIEGLDDQSVVIFEAGEENEDGSADLKPVSDEALLEKVYEQFCNEMDEQAASAEAAELDGCDCEDCDCDEDCDNCTCEDDCDTCGCKNDKGENE